MRHSSIELKNKLVPRLRKQTLYFSFSINPSSISRIKVLKIAGFALLLCYEFSYISDKLVFLDIGRNKKTNLGRNIRNKYCKYS